MQILRSLLLLGFHLRLNKQSRRAFIAFFMVFLQLVLVVRLVELLALVLLANEAKEFLCAPHRGVQHEHGAEDQVRVLVSQLGKSKRAALAHYLERAGTEGGTIWGLLPLSVRTRD